MKRLLLIAVLCMAAGGVVAQDAKASGSTVPAEFQGMWFVDCSKYPSQNLAFMMKASEREDAVSRFPVSGVKKLGAKKIEVSFGRNGGSETGLDTYELKGPETMIKVTRHGVSSTHYKCLKEIKKLGPPKGF